MAAYEQLTIENFGRQLLLSGDLDPIYIALNQMKVEDGLGIACFGKKRLNRWLLAYWCFYHAGVASYMCEMDSDMFWDFMMIAAKNETPCPVAGVERWPRGQERRHFRGENAIKSVTHLKDRYADPADMVDFIATNVTTLHDVSVKIQTHVGFGPWMGFKAADMVERVLNVPISFEAGEVFMFADPEKAAMLLWEMREGHKYPPGSKPKREQILFGVTNFLIEYFQSYPAPGGISRPVNIQEIETILCKWKSHIGGQYPLYNDIKEIGYGTKPWEAVSPTAALFNSCLPKVQGAINV